MAFGYNFKDEDGIKYDSFYYNTHGKDDKAFNNFWYHKNEQPLIMVVNTKYGKKVINKGWYSFDQNFILKEIKEIKNNKMADGGMMAKGGEINYLKKWRVKGINMQGKMFIKEITLGRMSDKNDVMYALKRMPDTNIREVTLIEEIKEDGGMMADGGELATYKIVEKYKYALGKPKWEDEKFQTGGREFLTFKQAQDFKKKLQEMTSSFEYKVVKVEDKMAQGGRLSRKQKQLDLNKNGKLDSQDFKMLRAGRKNARKK